ncbi:hypothetical protein [Acidovorax sp. Root217]|uniref:hypothetical protein n=1 Tax=Acidovorax sp. Root217 TaxID=1736492 RepID=UPI000AE84B23|nr:hypothetical protein [Acidovorax sp. Root217]
MESDKRLYKDSAGLAVGATAAIPMGAGLGAWLLPLLMLAIPVLALVDSAQRTPGWPLAGLAAASALFLVLEGRHASAAVRRTSLVLVAITLCLLPWIDAPLQALQRGVRIGGLIASLLVTVNLLSRVALRMPRVRAVVGGLYRLPAQRRYLGLTVASQFFGGLLGLAGIAMMMEMAAREADLTGPEKLSAFSAIARGYAAVSLWSPIYSNMGIALALYGGLDWVGVLPYVLAVSALLICLGLLVERCSREAGVPKPSNSQPALHETALLRLALPVLAAMLCFLGFMVAASRWLALPISSVIIASTPVAAWLLSVVLAAPGRRRLAQGTHMLGADFLGFRTMVGEVMMFFASGCAGTVIASAIPPAWTGAVGQWVAGAPVLGCLFVSGAIVLLSATAIHPMLSAVLVGSSFSPLLLGLPVVAHLCAVLTGWGLAIIVTPFSVLSLMACRHSGIPILTISLRANLLFVLLAITVSALLLGSMASSLLHP